MADEISKTLNKEMPNSSNAGVKSMLGMAALGITGTIAVGLLVGTLPFLTPALRQICLPYVPATKMQIQNILQMCKGRSGNVVDLGSGDGRVVRHILHVCNEKYLTPRRLKI